VCVMDAKGIVLSNRRCENSARRIVEGVKPYGTRIAAAIEACCGAAALADELLAAGWQVSLAHAASVNKLKQSPDKTDWSDARLQRLDPRWATLGGQLRRRGKPGSLVAAAVANRWVRWMSHQLRDVQAS
jgi:hypothetical protein